MRGRGFSLYEYSPRQQHEAPATPVERSDVPAFKHPALPVAPKKAGTFQRFRYTEDPYEHQDCLRRGPGGGLAEPDLAGLHSRKARVLAGAWHGGHMKLGDGKGALKSRANELKASLTARLRADVPRFRRLATDERGCLLALFAVDTLHGADALDAGLREYMGHLLETHPASHEFGLLRDPTRWGSVERAGTPQSNGGGSTSSTSRTLVYALRPPWVCNNGPVTARRLSPTKRRAPARHPPTV